MLRFFFSNPNFLGRLMVVLLFATGVVFAGAFDGFVVETDGKSCCGGTADDSVFSSSENNDEDCGCAEFCSCASSDDCDGSKGCSAEGNTCCYDSENSYDCDCSDNCGGKGPSKCDPGTSPC